MKRNLLLYALGENGKSVFVDDVANGSNCNCICPNCGELLIAKNNGIKKTHHFAHASGTECEYAHESMLHLLAKERIRDAFLKNDVFNMEFVYTSRCSKSSSCEFIRYSKCAIHKRKTFNLKEFYDSCEQEIAYDSIRRRSDLKIFSSAKPELKPIYIEFCVTHPSDNEKLHNGGKIIEINIESEADIDDIAQNGFIGQDVVDSYQEFEEEYERKDSKIAFYGFKDSDDKAEMTIEIGFYRYLLFKSGKTLFYNAPSSCKNIVKVNSYSLLEIVFYCSVAHGLYDIAKYQGYKRFGIKNCILCKNYVCSYEGVGKICRCYKSLGIQKWDILDTARAKTCNLFTIDQDEMKIKIKEFESMNPKEYTILG